MVAEVELATTLYTGSSALKSSKEISTMSKYEFPGDNIPIIKGSALNALTCEGGVDDPDFACIKELMDAVDSYIPTPDRKADQPFLMPVEDVFTITGRGTVATGRVERGTIKMNEEVEIVGPVSYTHLDAHVEGVVQVGLILQPGAPVGDDGGGVGDGARLISLQTQKSQKEMVW